MTGYDGRAYNNAALALVQDAWPLTGDAQAPGGLEYDTSSRLVKPYAVVYPLGAAVFDGSLAAGDEQDDAWPGSQVTCVGRDRDQVDALRSRIRAAVLGQSLVVAGRKVGPLRLDDESDIQRDDAVNPPLFYAVDRYRTYNTRS